MILVYITTAEHACWCVQASCSFYNENNTGVPTLWLWDCTQIVATLKLYVQSEGRIYPTKGYIPVTDTAKKRAVSNSFYHCTFPCTFLETMYLEIHIVSQFLMCIFTDRSEVRTACFSLLRKTVIAIPWPSALPTQIYTWNSTRTTLPTIKLPSSAENVKFWSLTHC